MAKIKKIDQAQDFFAISADVFRLWRVSWEALKLNLHTILFIVLVPIVLMMLLLGLVLMPWLMTGEFGVISIIASSVLGLALLIAGLFLFPAMVITQLESVQGRLVDFKDVMRRAVRIAFPLLGLMFSIMLIVLLGFVLVIIPGLLAIFFLTLAMYVFVDQQKGIKATIKESYRISKANWRLIFAMYVVNFAISFVGIVPIIGGLANIALSIVYFCLPAVIYLQIKK